MFECPQCGAMHLEPADARLGFLVVCLACVEADVVVVARDREFLPAA